MKLSLMFALPLLLAACASTPPPVQSPVTPIEVAPALPANVEVDRPKWSLTLPPDYVIRMVGAKTKGNVTQELMAHSPGMLGAAPVIVAVMTVALDADDPKDEDFGGAAAVVAKQQGGELLTAVPSAIDGHPGSIVMFVTPSGLLIIQFAAAFNRTGYVARCGGDVQQGDKIIDRCTQTLATFRIKK